MALNEGVVFGIIVISVGFMFIHFQLVTSSMDVSLTHGEPMVKNDQNYINLDNLRVRKVNRTHHLLIGNVTLYVNQGNEYDFQGLLYKKQGNDYKKLPYKIGPNKFCDLLSSDEMFYPYVHATSDFPSIGTCPWPKNVYHLFGYAIQLNSAPTIFPSGDYMIEAFSTLKGKMQNGYRIYGTLSNSKKLL